MSAALKSIVVAVLGLLVAIVVGYQVGEGSLVFPLAIAGACLLGFLYMTFLQKIRVEALIVGLLISGYLIGNRGFAQLGFGGPLFFGEVGLTVCLTFLLLRFALARRTLIPKTALSYSILALILVGAVRLYLDVFVHLSGAPTMLALRDSAVIYYAGFFYVAYQFGHDEKARLLVDRFVLFGCLVLLPIAAIQIWFPGFLMRFTFRGNPLIYQKGDIVTSYLAFASFYFFLRPARGGARLFFWIASVVAIIAMLLFLERAGLVGFALAAVLLIVARQPKFLIYQGSVAFIAVVMLLLLNTTGQSRGTVWLSQTSDKVSSIVDFSGTQKYSGAAGDEKAGNNQFRLVWWQNVINETMDKGPFLGLGFGYDLAQGFVRDYYANRGQFEARSPHSVWLTVLGRTGLIGLLSFIVVTFLICRGAFGAALRVARGRAPVETLAHWCAVLTLLGTASFGVVLEGPMGGVLFWSLLGLASSQTASRPQKIGLRSPAGTSFPRRTLEPALVR